MSPDFSQRSSLHELMDDPSVPPEEMAGTLEGLARVNTVLGGFAPSISGVERLNEGRPALSVLDVGTGCADTPRRLADWAARRGVDIYVQGIDISQVIVDYARSRCVAYKNIDVVRRDIFEMDEDECFDVVHAALMLHHLDDEGAVNALQKMYALSRLGVVINDLHRHRLAYYGSRALLPVLSRNHLIRHDGPVSVLRAFSREELQELVRRAGLPEPEIRWRPFFRWQVILRRER